MRANTLFVNRTERQDRDRAERPWRRLGEEARSLAEILTPASFGFFGGEYLARITYSINMIIADIMGMCLPVELRSGILADRKTRLPEKTEPQRRDFLTVATPSSPSPL